MRCHLGAGLPRHLRSGDEQRRVPPALPCPQRAPGRGLRTRLHALARHGSRAQGGAPPALLHREPRAAARLRRPRLHPPVRALLHDRPRHARSGRHRAPLRRAHPRRSARSSAAGPAPTTRSPSPTSSTPSSSARAKRWCTRSATRSPRGRRRGAPRKDLLWLLAEIPGVYVPSLFRAHYGGDRTISGYEPLKPGYESIVRRVIPDLNLVPQADEADRPFHAGRARPAAAGDPARLHARLPLLPGGDDHPSHAAARSQRGAPHRREGPRMPPATKRWASSRSQRRRLLLHRRRAGGLLRRVRAGERGHLAALAAHRDHVGAAGRGRSSACARAASPSRPRPPPSACAG